MRRQDRSFGVKEVPKLKKMLLPFEITNLCQNPTNTRREKKIKELRALELEIFMSMEMFG